MTKKLKDMTPKQQNWLKAEDCLISNSQKILYRAAQFVCLAPVRLEKRQSSWYMSISPTLWLINCCVITFCNICIFAGLIIDMIVGPEKSSRMTNTIRGLVWFCEIALTVLSSNICVYGGYKRTQKIIIVTKKLQKLNDTTFHCNFPKLSVLTFAIIMWLTSMVVWGYYMFIQNTIKNGRSIYSAVCYFCYYLAYHIVKIEILQFIFIALEGYKSIKFINDQFEDAVESCKTISHGSKLKTIGCSNTMTVRRLISMYDRAFKTVAEINECYGLLLLVSFAVIFKDLVHTCYNVISSIQELKNYPLLIMQSIWMVIQVLSLIGLVEPCHRTQQEVDRTRCLVNHLSLSFLDSVEMDRFSRFMALVNASYSPMGMFTVSRCLIVTMLASVLSHLMILVQFQGEDKGEFPNNAF